MKFGVPVRNYTKKCCFLECLLGVTKKLFVIPYNHTTLYFRHHNCLYENVLCLLLIYSLLL